MNAGFKIKRRDDLVPPAVDLKFRISGTVGGNTYTQVIHDIAAKIGGTVLEGIGMTGKLVGVTKFTSPSLPGDYIGGSVNSSLMQQLESAGRDFNAVSATIDMQGASSQVQSCTFVTVPVDIRTPKPSSGYTVAQTFWQTVFPELKEMGTDLDFAAGSTVSVVDDTGTAIDTSVFQYHLTRGQVAPWMLVGNAYGGAGAQSVNAHITVQFTGTENAYSGSTAVEVGHHPQHIKHVTATLVTLPGGTYTKQTVTQGEIIPYGLAGYIYNIARMVQYEGSFTLQETEITDPVPMGNVLNITGGLAEWGGMEAMIQSISYDLVNARTNITFGPAAHLGAKDFVERLRANRPLRGYNLNGNNLANIANANTAQLGSDVAKADPANSSKLQDLHIYHSNITDSALGYSLGYPGVNIDSRLSGQPNYIGLGAQNVPVVMLAKGSGGNITIASYMDANGNLIITNNGVKTIQLKLSDIPGGFPPTGISPVIKIREWQVCDSSGNPYYALFLSSAPYTTALTESPL